MDEERTFFCSELIAKAYKVLGVIEDCKRSCANYYPSSFSSKDQDLELMPGMHLEQELNIVVKIPSEGDLVVSSGKRLLG